MRNVAHTIGHRVSGIAFGLCPSGAGCIGAQEVLHPLQGHKRLGRGCRRGGGGGGSGVKTDTSNPASTFLGVLVIARRQINKQY
jgi:hypothetical protein